jgi:predicted molibdopterin-dependent oxidoreductase YjgC
VCSEVVGVSAYGYINRGFGTVVMPALGGSLLDTECVSCGLCIGTCPTGAITQKIPLAKPGPWKTDRVPSVCHYCGVGCSIDYDVFGDTLVKTSRDDGNGITFGGHCKKGRFGFGYVHAPDRLVKARIRPGREMQDAQIGEAIAYAALRLKELSRHVSGREIAVFVSPRLTNEEIYLAQKLARIALKTHNITSFAHLVNQDLSSHDVAATANYRDLVDAQTLLVVNANPDEEHFVVDLLGKRAVRSGAKLIYIGSGENRTARFAEVSLQCRSEEQSTVVLGLLAEYGRVTGTPPDVPEEIQAAMASLTPEEVERRSGAAASAIREAATVLSKSILKVLVFNRDYRGPRKAGDSRLFAAVAPALGCGLLPLHEQANMQGLLDMGASPGWYPGYQPVGDSRVIDEFEKEWCVALRDLETGNGNVAQLLAEKKIKVALVFGEDPLACGSLPPAIRDGLLATEFLVVGDLFLTETAKAANVVLPLSSAAETAGTFTNSERRVQQMRRAIPPTAGIETWEVLCQLGARMGFRFKMQYGHPDDIFQEIRRVTPIYRDVAIGSQEPDSIWDLSHFHLTAAGPKYDLDAPGVTPAATLPLDYLENRFARWFSAQFPAALGEKAQSA